MASGSLVVVSEVLAIGKSLLCMLVSVLRDEVTVARSGCHSGVVIVGMAAVVGLAAFSLASVVGEVNFDVSVGEEEAMTVSVLGTMLERDIRLIRSNTTSLAIAVEEILWGS